MVRRAVVHICGQPQGITHLRALDKGQQLGDFQLAAQRRAVVAVGNSLPARPIGYVKSYGHVGSDHLPGSPRGVQLALEPGQLLLTEKGRLRPLLPLQVMAVRPAVTAHVQHEQLQQRPIADLAVDAPQPVTAGLTHRCVLQVSLARAAYQCIDIAHLIPAVQLHARRPVVGHLVVVPLPDLRHLGVERTQVLIQQVVAVVATELVQGLGNLALLFGDQIAPEAAILGRHFGGDRPVGVDHVAAVQKEIRVALAHGFVDAQTTEVRVDA